MHLPMEEFHHLLVEVPLIYYNRLILSLSLMFLCLIGSSFRLAAELSVEEKLQQKLEAKAAKKAASVKAKTETKKVEKKVEVSKKVKVSKPEKAVQAPAPIKASKTYTLPKADVKAAPVAKIVAPVEIKKVEPVIAAAPVTKTVTSTSVPVEANAITTGIALGSAPYLLIALVAASAAGGLLKKPKTVITGPKVTKGAFTKPINVGAKEGIDELLSGKVTEELELSRKGIKLSLAGFGAAAAGAALLLASSSQNTQVAEVKKPAPAPVVKEAPKPVEVKKEAPAPVEVKKEAPKPVEKPVEVKKEAPAPVEVKKEAPAPVEVKKEAPKPVEVKKEAPKSVEVKKEEVYVPTVPKGMEVEKVDLEALKALRKVKK